MYLFIYLFIYLCCIFILFVLYVTFMFWGSVMIVKADDHVLMGWFSSCAKLEIICTLYFCVYGFEIRPSAMSGCVDLFDILV